MKVDNFQAVQQELNEHQVQFNVNTTNWKTMIKLLKENEIERTNNKDKAKNFFTPLRDPDIF